MVTNRPIVFLLLVAGLLMTEICANEVQRNKGNIVHAVVARQAIVEESTDEETTDSSSSNSK